jgi:uncharacterized protein YqcC (DUF446 family)
LSQAGEVHQKMMRKIECAFANLLDAQARLENAGFGEEGEPLAESLQAVHSFLIEAMKLARWLDTGEA